MRFAIRDTRLTIVLSAALTVGDLVGQGSTHATHQAQQT
jgi:hypothetical protein